MKRVKGFVHRHLVAMLVTLGVLLSSGLAYAIFNNGVFEIVEGDLCNPLAGDVPGDECDSSNPWDEDFTILGLPQYDGEDWETIWNVVKNGAPSTDTAAEAYLWMTDSDTEALPQCPPEGFYSTSEDFANIFFGGQTNKDFDDIPGWTWNTKTPNDKNDLTNVMAALYRAEVDAAHDGPENVLYFAADRLATEGSAYTGFWILKEKIGLRCGDRFGEFLGIHRPGDLLLLTNYSQGGAVGTINIFKWRNACDPEVTPACDTGAPDDTLGNSDQHPNLDLIAIQQDCDFPNLSTNFVGCGSSNTLDKADGATETAPWPYQAKQTGNPKYGPGEYPPLAFIEGGINLDAQLVQLSGCFQGFLAESRNSPSLSASREDLALGDFETCGFTIEKTGDTLAKVGDEVTYTFTITNTGIEDLYIQSVEDDVIGNITGDATTACGAFVAADDGADNDNNVCTFDVTYTIQDGDVVNDEVVNTVTVTLNENSGLDGLEFVNMDDHTLDIFTLDIEFTKSGPTLAKTGDDITYTYTLTDNSSDNAPALTCTVSDPDLGLDGEPISFSDTLVALGSQEAPDAADVTNTATVTCMADGYDNEVEDSDSHTVDLFQPSIDFTKSGPTLAKTGDTINYTYTLTNTSSDNTPALSCTVSDPDLGLDGPIAFSDTGVALGSQTAPDETSVTNTATVTCSIDGFPNEVDDTDSHTVNLFEVSVEFTKSGPDLVKTGDDIDYTYTLTNTSSDNAPALSCTVSDPDLGLDGDSIVFSDTPTALGKQTAPGGDEVTNTAIVTCSVDGYANVVTDSASYTVDLFQPSVDFTKSGPGLTKSGDTINYTYTLINTSSDNTPALSCTVSDPDLGVGGAIAFSDTPAALGNRTAPVSDEVTNTATVSCTIAGFQNVVGDSDSHTVPLFQPSVDFTKSGPGLTKSGDTINYTYTLINTSSDNTPALSCTVSDPDLGLGGAIAFSDTPAALGNRTAPVSDEVTNTATVSCTIAGFQNVVGDSDSHTVPLFQPAIDVVKSGDDYTKVGDTINYSATLTNNSSTNTPALVIDSISDSLAGDLVAGPNVVSSDCGASLGNGASCTVEFSYITQEADDDGTLNNTVTVQTSVTDFPNDIDDTDDHEATILHPDYLLDKSCQAEPADLGAAISFFVTLENHGDVEVDVLLTDPDLAGSPLNITLGVSDGSCDETELDNGDPSDGCHRIEGSITADTVGTQQLRTATGLGTISAVPGLPNQIERMDDTTCEVTDIGATRTLGFWKSHISDGDLFGEPEWSGSVQYGYTCHVFTEHMGSSMDLGWKQVSTCEELFGIFWSHPSRESDGGKRSKSCAAQIGSSDILAAALLNMALDNGASIDPQLIADLQNALASGNFKAIKAAAGPVNAYNESGDDQAIIDNDGTFIPHADPKGGKSIANYSFGDCN
ncbi:hypothetical protein FV139_15885 [Parahaliea maris]|uniref:DUF7507 domain-containing protein n=1 Tax=Parahaliea maris TaxID=2716870 RepID=A0A5C8ZVC7_9GAMM|nr:hypothetical protein [Parahaliea maris]TXS91221.1 hypothetical protein FV139_15885 [Parahaliea maris]